MKNFLLTFIFILFFSVIIYSQEADTIKVAKKNIHCDFSLSVSDPYILSLYSQESLSIFDFYDEIYDDWFEIDSYRGMRFTTCPISMTYLLKLKKWFWIGGSISYMGIYSENYDRVTREQIGVNREHFVQIAPVAHFAWLNKKMIRLYSSLSVGAMFFSSHYGKDKNFNIYPHGQLTCIGVAVGKKWYGFGEFGVGTKSILTAGVGYRFNLKK